MVRRGDVLMTRGTRSSEFVICLLGTLAGVGMALYGIQAGEIMAALSIPAAFIAGRSGVKMAKGEQ